MAIDLADFRNKGGKVEDLMHHGGNNGGNNDGDHYYSERPHASGFDAYAVNTGEELPQSDTFGVTNVPTAEYAQKFQNTISKDYAGYQARGDKYQGTYSQTQTEQAWNYLNRYYKTASSMDWGVPDPNDEVFSIGRGWDNDKEMLRLAEEQAKEPLSRSNALDVDTSKMNESQKEIHYAVDIEEGNYKLAKGGTKALYAGTAGVAGRSDEVETNLNTLEDKLLKVSENILPFAMSAGMGAKLGGILGSVIPGIGNVVGAVAGATLMGGATILDRNGIVDIPAIGKFNEVMDWAGAKLEQGQGVLGSALAEANDKTDNFKDLITTTVNIIQENPNLAEVAKYSYEVGADFGLGDLARGVRNAGVFVANHFGADIDYRERNDVNRANLALDDLYKVSEGTIGYKALYETYLPLYNMYSDYFKDKTKEDGTHYTTEEIAQLTNSYLQEALRKEMGTTGFVRDFSAQSIADPMNAMPWLESEIVKDVGKATGSKSLEWGGKHAQGNLLVDLTPDPIRPFVEMLDKDATSSKGFAGAFNLAEFAAQNVLDTKDMNGIDFRIGKVDEATGTIKDFDTSGSWIKETNESKVYSVESDVTAQIGSILFGDNYTEMQTSHIVDQLVGAEPITPGSPLYEMSKTASFKTMQATLNDMPVETRNRIINNLASFDQYANNRLTLDGVAKALNIDPKKLLDEINKKGVEKSELVKRYLKYPSDIVDEAGNIVVSGSEVKETLKAFEGNEGKARYSKTMQNAYVMTELVDYSTDYMMKKLNVTPDRWATRLSNLNKSVQSIALLNFSPSYIVNNWLNNQITRAIDGVGGAVGKVWNELNEKRGFFDPTAVDAYEDVKNVVGSAKKATDTLQKVQDAWNKITSDDTAVGKILKGANNIPIEELENSRAFKIGANQLWNRDWKAGVGFKSVKEALGDILSEEDCKRLDDIIQSSNNIKEIRDALYKDRTIPTARTVFEHMMDNMFDDSDQGIASKAMYSDWIDKNSYICDYIDTMINQSGGKVSDVVNVFDAVNDYLTSQLEMKNAVQILSSYEEIRNAVSAEGWAKAAEYMKTLNDLQNDMWKNSTKMSEKMFFDRVAKKIAGKDFDKMWAAHQKSLETDFGIISGYISCYMAAIADGLGIEGKMAKDFIFNAQSSFDLDKILMNQDRMLYRKYKKSPEGNYDNYVRDKRKMLKKYYDAKEILNIKSDAVLVEHLRNTLDDTWTGTIDQVESLLKQAQEYERKLYDAEMQQHEETYYAKDIREKQKQWTPFDKENIKSKQYIYSLRNDAYSLMTEMLGDVQQNVVEDVPLDLSGTLRMEMNYEEYKYASKKATDTIKNQNKRKKSQPVEKPRYKNKEYPNGSFEDYVHKAVGNDPATFDKIQNLYDEGTAVTIGSVKINPASETLHHGYDESLLIGKKTNKEGTLVQKTYAFYHGDEIANCVVIHNGKEIAVITPNTPKTVEFENYKFPVIGSDINNPNAYILVVGDKFRTVEVGKPKGYNPTAFANQKVHPNRFGTTASPMPEGLANLEMNSTFVRPMLNDWRKAYMDTYNAGFENSSIMSKLSPEARTKLMDYVEGNVSSEMNAQRYRAIKYGKMMQEGSMLNYSKRYGFDNAIGLIMPYQFWMTRSMMNWASRAIDRPSWFAMYARLQKLANKNIKDLQPSRLDGYIGIPMPNMPDGFGDTLYFDAMGQIFPFIQFFDGQKYYAQNLKRVQKQAIRKITELQEKCPINGTVDYNGKTYTYDEVNDACKFGRGELYRIMFEEAKAESGSDVGMGALAETSLSLPLVGDMFMKLVRNQKDQLSYTPMSRLGNQVRAFGDNTLIEGFTNRIGDALQLPEKIRREAFGFEMNPEVTNNADSQIDNKIVFMMYEGKIGKAEAISAMAEGDGNPIYEEAKSQLRQEQAYKQQGGMLANEIGQSISGNKKTSFGQMAGAAIGSVFGARVEPEGEKRYREEQARYYDAVKSGSEELISKFWDDNPDHEVRNYAWERDPEKRLHNILLGELNDAFNSLSDANKSAAINAFGDEFTMKWLKKETRCTDDISDETLISWIRAMNGVVPNISKANTERSQKPYEILWYSQSVQGKQERFNREMEQKFGKNWKEVDSGYYNVPESKREEYKRMYPQWQQIQDYRNQIYNANPDLKQFNLEKNIGYQMSQGKYQNITDAIIGTLNDWDRKKVKEYINYGYQIPTNTQTRLRSAFTALAIRNPTVRTIGYEGWLKSIGNW